MISLIQKTSQLKLAFINPPHADWIIPNVATWLFMQSHYNAVGKHKDKVIWLPAPYRYNQYSSIKDLFEEVKEADIILFSSYIWNYDLCDDLASYIKQHYPTKITILGGPHIGELDRKFFASRNHYDYICRPTKPGETFIEDFINLWFDESGLPDPDKISWETRSVFGKDHPFPQVSVYEQHIDYLSIISRYAEENQLEKFVIMETTRGCPYQCTFCEWGGGIGAKVIKKDIEICKKDLLALKAAGFTDAFLTDANFGIYEERDLEVFSFAWQNGIRLTDISTVKVKNLERRKRLIDRCFDIIGKGPNLHTGCIPTVSLQSVSDEAMKVAKRVDLSLEDKIILSEHIYKKCNQENIIPPSIELILGMPGSTLDDFYTEFELLWNFRSWNSYRHDYMFLPDAENSSEDFVKRNQIQLVEVYTDLIDEEGVDNIHSFYASKRNYFKTIKSCYSYTQDQMYEMFFMNQAGNILLRDFYDPLVSVVSPSEFGKKSYQAIKRIKGFDSIHNQIINIYNEDTDPASIKKINNQNRKIAIEQFIRENQIEIINNLMKEILLEETV